MIRSLLTALSALILSIAPIDFVSAEDPDPSPAVTVDLTLQQYHLADEEDYDVPVLSAYWGDLLLEGRYNYEGRDVASLWLGRPFSFGEEWQFELTPMLGGLFGITSGAAPGGKADLTWRYMNLYSEFEYVFNFESREENFFYSWTEMTGSPVEHLRIGIVGNRTRAYQSAVDIDRGPIVKLEFEQITVSCTAFLDGPPIFIFGAELSFDGSRLRRRRSSLPK